MLRKNTYSVREWNINFYTFAYITAEILYSVYVKIYANISLYVKSSHGTIAHEGRIPSVYNINLTSTHRPCSLPTGNTCWAGRPGTGSCGFCQWGTCLWVRLVPCTCTLGSGGCFFWKIRNNLHNAQRSACQSRAAGGKYRLKITNDANAILTVTTVYAVMFARTSIPTNFARDVQ